MIVLALGILAVLIIAAIYYRFFLKPKQLIAFYRKAFANAKFRVYQMPFKAMDVPEFSQLQEN